MLEGVAMGKGTEIVGDGTGVCRIVGTETANEVKPQT